MDNIYDLLEKPISDAEIKQQLGDDAKIILYSELKEYVSIQELLPNKRLDYVIILVEISGKNTGHWFCVVRNNNNIMVFDSYGVRPDKNLRWIDTYMRKKLNQNEPFLSYLLNKAKDDGFKVSFNGFEYQQLKSGVSTCGRHVINFINYFKMNNNVNLKTYKKYMDDLRDRYKLNYDLLVTKNNH